MPAPSLWIGTSFSPPQSHRHRHTEVCLTSPVGATATRVPNRCPATSSRGGANSVQARRVDPQLPRLREDLRPVAQAPPAPGA